MNFYICREQQSYEIRLTRSGQNDQRLRDKYESWYLSVLQNNLGKKEDPKTDTNGKWERIKSKDGS
ncbi:MAG: hypothetical protein F6K24_14455 [Okeania sp. SIO2D1]|uniref:hypothetical protein n=1 Tax=Okeania sp. SIO2C9 TaxID=2607791 RepID=UPI0013BE3FB1|nr:hypothetical protein [Okeania sp. SIO2C9]NEQ76194.1 hypothetical protein [Okeania sp. SIO2C9]NES66369.1 hypothetical protein [Okeania sp. SIO2D1]